jgi:hypothetical protein
MSAPKVLALAALFLATTFAQAEWKGFTFPDENYDEQQSSRMGTVSIDEYLSLHGRRLRAIEITPSEGHRWGSNSQPCWRDGIRTTPRRYWR